MDEFGANVEPLRPASIPAGERPAAHLPHFGPDGPRPEAVAALLAHPRFAAASRTAHTGYMELWRGNRLLNTLVNDRGRLLISMFAIHLHLLSRPNDPHSGLTVSRMTALCSEQNFCSPGRAKAMLMLMRVFGYLVPSPNEADRRLRRLVPTDRLLAMHRERNRNLFRAIAMVLPECAEAFSAQSRPGFTEFFICRYCEQLLTGFRFIDRVPDMRLFVEHNSGVMILANIMLSGEADDVYPPVRPVPVSSSALARRFGVSRAHVRRLLHEAENRGLLEKQDGDRSRILPRLAQASNEFLAMHFLLAADCAQGAYADIGQESAVA